MKINLHDSYRCRECNAELDYSMITTSFIHPLSTSCAKSLTSISIKDSKLVKGTAKRESVGYLFTVLDWNFIKALAQLAKHGSDKYDDPNDPVPNYQKGVLTRDKSPINHLCNHLTSYQLREPHDHLGSPKWHLVAIAFNAMIEFFHFKELEFKHHKITYNFDPPAANDQEPEKSLLSCGYCGFELNSKSKCINNICRFNK